MQWLGSSDHHLKFPGTISVPSDLYIDLVCHICECILSAGFRRIFLLLSHGGNDVPCQEVIYRLGMKHRDRRGLLDRQRRLVVAGRRRAAAAGDGDAAADSRLRVRDVDGAGPPRRPGGHDAGQGSAPRLESKYYFPDPDDARRSKVHVSLPFEQMTATGAIGRPELGTADKGHKLLEAATARIIDFVREFAHWQRPQIT